MLWCRSDSEDGDGGGGRALHYEEEAVDGGVREVRRIEELYWEFCEEQQKEVRNTSWVRRSNK